MGVRLYIMAAKSGKEIMGPWFQKYKLRNGVVFFSCQQIGAEMGETGICEGKWHVHWSWLICYVSWFVFPVFWRSSMDTHSLLGQRPSQEQFMQQPASSASEISLLIANVIFYLADVSAGSLVLLTFASPAAPTPDCAPSPAVAWLTHFLPHLLPNDCWTPFPNSGSAPPLWLAAQFAAVAACLVISLWKCYSHTSLEL